MSKYVESAHVYKAAKYLAWVAYLVMLLSYILFAIHAVSFSPDSWTYYELSKTIFSSDFYHVNNWRQFQSTDPYSMSFPPFWPVVIALFNLIFNMGPAGMPLVAGSFTLATTLVLERIFARFFKINAMGLAFGFFLLFYHPYMDEVVAGRSIPIFIFIEVCILYFWLEELKAKNLVIIGILSGLLVLTRFDSLPVVIVFSIMVLFRLWRTPAKWPLVESSGKPMWLGRFFESLCYILIILVTISPYAYYSYTHFGKLWISDNSLIAISSSHAFVTDFFNIPPLTVFDDPYAFTEKIMFNLSRLVSSAVFLSITAILFLALMLLAWRSFARVSNVVSPGVNYREQVRMTSLVGCMLIAFLSSLVGYLMTGYMASRYFTPLILLMFIFLFGVLYLSSSMQVLLKNVAVILVMMIIILLLAVVAADSKTRPVTYIFKNIANISYTSEAELYVKHRFSEIERCYIDGESKNSILVLDQDKLSAQISALTGIKTLMKPNNIMSMNRDETVKFINKFHVGSLLLVNNEGHIIGERIKDFGFLFEQCRYSDNYYFIKNETYVDQ